MPLDQHVNESHLRRGKQSGTEDRWVRGARSGSPPWPRMAGLKRLLRPLAAVLADAMVSGRLTGGGGELPAASGQAIPLTCRRRNRSADQECGGPRGAVPIASCPVGGPAASGTEGGELVSTINSNDMTMTTTMSNFILVLSILGDVEARDDPSPSA